jgi:hypothetical protein
MSGVALLPPAAVAAPAESDATSASANFASSTLGAGGSDSFLAAPLSPEERFDLDNFAARASSASGDVAAARTADYEFLRTLASVDRRGSVGVSPNRNYEEIQAQLAANLEQSNSASDITDLSAYLFGMTSNNSSASASTDSSSLNFLTPEEVAGISGWQDVKASWYGPGFYGNHTADGTVYNDSILLVAHKTLRLGSKVAISYGGRTLIVPVKDRGPYIPGRTFDLSAGLAKALNFSGVQTVRWALIDD